MTFQVQKRFSDDCKLGKSLSSEASVSFIHPVLSWTFHDICNWLSELRLQQYTDTFVSHAITNGRILLQLTQENLKEMGISKVGHRLAMSNALDKLRNAGPMVPRASVPSPVEFSDRIEGARCPQNYMYPQRIILVRHAESQGNVDRSCYLHIPDWKMRLTEEGNRQALAAGKRLKEIIADQTLGFYVSPYNRCKETLEGLCQAFSEEQILYKKEDYRIREQECGYFQAPDRMQKVMAERRKVGAFFYRFPNGESGADVYDRASLFLQSFYRDMERGRCGQNAIIVSHGFFCRIFLTRFYRWKVEFFHSLRNFENCQFAIMALQPEGDYKLCSELKYR